MRQERGLALVIVDKYSRALGITIAKPLRDRLTIIIYTLREIYFRSNTHSSMRTVSTAGQICVLQSKNTSEMPRNRTVKITFFAQNNKQQVIDSPL